jgi:hypothetical protein
MSKQARQFIVRYLKNAHSSIIDPLVAALDLEGSHQSYMVSYRNFYAVLIERTLWEAYSYEIKAADEPIALYAQLLDNERGQIFYPMP